MVLSLKKKKVFCVLFEIAEDLEIYKRAFFAIDIFSLLETQMHTNKF